jgi:ABC-type Fe3+/spermidine/putrescine transport system ATPase subunit
LVLFGTIKGIKSDSIQAEANKRIEEVRLTESANQRAGAFSGGMKRRLSVAVALIGNPEVVILLFIIMILKFQIALINSILYISNSIVNRFTVSSHA